MGIREQTYQSEMKRVIDIRFNARSFDGRALFLFGHCNATEEMVDYLSKKHIAASAIFDNSVSKQGLLCRGIPIVPPEQILDYSANDCIVLIAARFYAEMSAQLQQLGYKGEVVKVAEYNTFADYSLSDETIKRKKARMLRGVRTLERIRDAYSRQHLVICPNNALGDVYWAMAFLPAYRRKRGINEVVVVVNGNGCRQVAELFRADNIVQLDRSEMDEFVQGVLFTREENSIIAHHDRPYTDNIIKYLDKHLLSFIDYYRCAVYDLPRDTEPAPPTGFLKYAGAEQFVPGKTLIIAPYAKSVVRPQDRFWEKLVVEWRNKGYYIFTSVNNGEQPIKGTLPLSLQLNQMLSAVEHAGVFIGLRSGLCDIVHTSNCRKIVVFPDCYYSTTPHKIKDFFELPGWEKIVR